MNDVLRKRALANLGVFTAMDARECNVTSKSLASAIRIGTVVRVSRGAYAIGELHSASAPTQRHELATRAVIRGSGGHLVASHYSALTLLSLPVFGVDLDQVQVATRVGSKSRQRPDVWVHSSYPIAAIGSVEGTPTVHPAVAVIGTAMIHGVESGVVSADAALASSLTTRAELTEWMARMERSPFLAQARRAVDLADARAESPGESRTRVLLVGLNLGEVVPQAEIRDEFGRFVARVDFRYRHRKVIVEFDGLLKYDGLMGKQALVAEKRREDRLRSLGYAVVRLTSADLSDPAGVRALVLRGFAVAGATAPS